MVDSQGVRVESIDILLLRGSIRLSPGRYQFVAMQIEARLTDEERKVVAGMLRDALASAKEAVRLVRTRQPASKAKYGESATERDVDVDAQLAIIEALLEGTVRAESAESVEGRAARSLIGALLPGGADAITTKAYPEEAALLLSLLEAAKKPEILSDVAMIPGLGAQLEKLGRRTQAFVDALERDAPRGVSYREAKVAEDAAERRLLELISALLVHHRGDGAAAASRRYALLNPYVAQLDAVRARYRRRLPPADVDPQTGAILEETEGDGVDGGDGTPRGGV
jgi:hypothetical protein